MRWKGKHLYSVSQVNLSFIHEHSHIAYFYHRLSGVAFGARTFSALRKLILL